jgi:hypothetical protein
MIVRVFQEASGHVRIMRLNQKMRVQGETDVQFASRMFPLETAKQADLAGLSFVDMDETDLPTNRANRDKFRLKKRGGKDIVG